MISRISRPCLRIKDDADFLSLKESTYVPDLRIERGLLKAVVGPIAGDGLPDHRMQGLRLERLRGYSLAVGDSITVSREIVKVVTYT